MVKAYFVHILSTNTRAVMLPVVSAPAVQRTTNYFLAIKKQLVMVVHSHIEQLDPECSPVAGGWKKQYTQATERHNNVS